MLYILKTTHDTWLEAGKDTEGGEGTQHHHSANTPNSSWLRGAGRFTPSHTAGYDKEMINARPPPASNYIY